MKAEEQSKKKQSKGKPLLLLSRRQAWLEVSARRAEEACCPSLERTEALAEEAIRRAERACESERKEESWLVAKWSREEAEARVRRAKKEAAAAANASASAPPPSPAAQQPPPPPPPPPASVGYYS